MIALCTQITNPISYITADKIYDMDMVFQTLDAYMALGVAKWKKPKHYGRQNVSEIAIQRYKKIIGPKLHSRNFTNQTQEILIRYSILNRFTHIKMSNIYRVT